MISEDLDIRWQQRFENFKKALLQLEAAVNCAKQRSLSVLEEQGLIKSFEFTEELSWKVMKDYFNFYGNTIVRFPRDAIREAFKAELIKDGAGWMEIVSSRNETAHTYNEKIADEIVVKIIQDYYPLFQEFQKKMEELQSSMNFFDTNFFNQNFYSNNPRNKFDEEELSKKSLDDSLKSCGLKSKVIYSIQKIFSLHPHVDKTILYGSRAKGTYRQDSDIDLTLHGQHLSYEELMIIKNQLDDLLLPYEIDLSLYQFIDNEKLLEHIRRVGIVFYSAAPTS